MKVAVWTKLGNELQQTCDEPQGSSSMNHMMKSAFARSKNFQGRIKRNFQSPAAIGKYQPIRLDVIILSSETMFQILAIEPYDHAKRNRCPPGPTILTATAAPLLPRSALLNFVYCVTSSCHYLSRSHSSSRFSCE